MLEKFNKFKSRIVIHLFLYWIINFIIISLVINGFGILVLNVEYGNTDSMFTNIYALFALPISFLLPTYLTKNYRVKKYLKWIELNFQKNDPNATEILNKLMILKVLDKGEIQYSGINDENKSFILEFSTDQVNRVNSLLERYKHFKIKPEYFVFSDRMVSSYVIIAITLSILLSWLLFYNILISLRWFSLNSVNEILTILFFVLMSFSFYKLYAILSKRYKNKAILIIDKKGITYKNSFYEWGAIRISEDFLDCFEDLYPNQKEIDLNFRYNNKKIELNFYTSKTIEIFNHILVHGVIDNKAMERKNY